MTTTMPESVQFMKIVLDWCSPQVARSMLDDMAFYIAGVTDNDSIKESIKMVRENLYNMAEESYGTPYPDEIENTHPDYQLDN